MALHVVQIEVLVASRNGCTHSAHTSPGHNVPAEAPQGQLGTTAVAVASPSAFPRCSLRGGACRDRQPLLPRAQDMQLSARTATLNLTCGRWQTPRCRQSRSEAPCPQQAVAPYACHASTSPSLLPLGVIREARGAPEMECPRSPEPSVPSRSNAMAE